MLKIFQVAALLLILVNHSFADECTFTDSGDNLEELTMCPSFIDADKSQVRFAQIDSIEEEELFVGPSRYLLNSETEIFDPELFTMESGNCISDEGSSAVADHIGKDVAFILEDVGPLDERVVMKIWLLDCDIAQGR